MARKQWFMIFLAVLLIAGFCLGGLAQADDKVYKMKSACATTGKEASYYYGLRYMKARIEQLSKQIDMTIGYGTLGGERQLLEGIQLGTIQATCVTSAVLGNFVPEVQLFDVPFIFKDWAHVQRVVDGPYGDMIKEKALEKGIRILGWWQVGARDMYYNGKAIKEPADLKGVKMRIIQSPIFIELYKAMGAIPVPMAWPECYVGLKQGTIDGVDSILAYGYPMKHHEVVKFATITHHVYCPAPFVVSERWWKTLPQDVKNVILQAEVEAKKVEREADIRLTAEAAKMWEDYGVEVIWEPKLEEFRKVALSIYPKFEKELGKEKLDWILSLSEVPEGAENP